MQSGFITHTFDDFITALRISGATIRNTSSGIVANCPAHQDRTPSLAVSQGIDDKVLVNCFAGCTYESVINALNLPSYSNPPLHRGPSSTPLSLATYEYHDENGAVLFRKIRFPEKRFEFQRPDGTRGIEDCRRVLYNLDKLNDAIDANTPVHLVEGEKDADAITAAGGFATTNPMGASEWRNDYSESLRGAHVVLVADNDTPGEKRAVKLVPELERVAATLRIVKAKAGNDAFDHLRAGHGLGDFVEFIPTPVKQGVRFVRMDEVDGQPIEWLWDQYIALRAVTIIDGEPGLGKSTALIDIAARVSNGANMPDNTQGIEASNVLMLSAEDDLAHVLVPRLRAAGANMSRVGTLEVQEDKFVRGIVLADADLDTLEDEAHKRKVRVIVIDPLMAHMPSGIDSHKDQDVRRPLARLARIASSLNAAIILVRHLNKTEGKSALNRGGGSIGIVGAARAGYIIGQHPTTPTSRVLACVKNNLAISPPSMEFELVQAENGVAKIKWIGSSDISANQLVAPKNPSAAAERNDAKEFLKATLADGELPATEVQELAKQEGFNPRTLRRAKKELGVVSNRHGFGSDGIVFWKLPDPHRGPNENGSTALQIPTQYNDDRGM